MEEPLCLIQGKQQRLLAPCSNAGRGGERSHRFQGDDSNSDVSRELANRALWEGKLCTEFPRAAHPEESSNHRLNGHAGCQQRLVSLTLIRTGHKASLRNDASRALPNLLSDTEMDIDKYKWKSMYISSFTRLLYVSLCVLRGAIGLENRGGFTGHSF